jgi:hypothetical protein
MVVFRVITGVSHHAINRVVAATPGIKEQLAEKGLVAAPARRGDR